MAILPSTYPWTQLLYSYVIATEYLIHFGRMIKMSWIYHLSLQFDKDADICIKHFTI